MSKVIYLYALLQAFAALPVFINPTFAQNAPVGHVTVPHPAETKEFAYISENKGLLEYQVTQNGVLQPLQPPYVALGGWADLTTCDSQTHTLYLPSYQPDNLIYEYHISLSGNLIPLKPLFIKTKGSVSFLIVNRQRHLLFASADQLEEYAINQNGLLKWKSSYKDDGAVIISPTAHDLYTEYVPYGTLLLDVSHYSIASHGQLHKISEDLHSSMGGCFALSPSGKTFCKLVLIHRKFQLGIYRISPWHPVPRKPLASTSLPGEWFSGISGLVCTDKYVFASQYDTTPDGLDIQKATKVREYEITASGHLALLHDSAARPVYEPIPFLDSTGRFLYVISSFSGTLDTYKIEKDGSLTWEQNIKGLTRNAVLSMYFCD